MIRLISLVFVLAFSLNSHVLASPPELVSYQGQLTDENGNPFGYPQSATSANLSFSLYDGAEVAANLIWGPQTFTNVPVVNGSFNVILGPLDEQKTPRSLTASLEAGSAYLQTKVNNEAPILPRQQLLSSPYALQAVNSALVDGRDLTYEFDLETAASDSEFVRVDGRIDKVEGFIRKPRYKNCEPIHKPDNCHKSWTLECPAGKVMKGLYNHGGKNSCSGIVCCDVSYGG